jgi:serine/threonine protein kinase
VKFCLYNKTLSTNSLFHHPLISYCRKPSETWLPFSRHLLEITPTPLCHLFLTHRHLKRLSLMPATPQIVPSRCDDAGNQTRPCERKSSHHPDRRLLGRNKLGRVAITTYIDAPNMWSPGLRRREDSASGSSPGYGISRVTLGFFFPTRTLTPGTLTRNPYGV